MDVDNLIHMANRIGEFFQAMPDRTEAVEGVATHIHKFWEPRMRTALFAALDAGAADALLPVVREALDSRRSELIG
jgi:formate dehydrogenase subunit delta